MENPNSLNQMFISVADAKKIEKAEIFYGVATLELSAKNNDFTKNKHRAILQQAKDLLDSISNYDKESALYTNITTVLDKIKPKQDNVM